MYIIEIKNQLSCYGNITHWCFGWLIIKKKNSLKFTSHRESCDGTNFFSNENHSYNYKLLSR